MLRNQRASITFIFITILLDVIGISIIIPIVPKLIEELIHGNISDASRYGGWLMFSYAFMQFLFAPVLGGISDRVGRKPVILVSLFFLGIDYLVHAFAPNITWLFIGRIFAGISGSSISAANAYIADVSSPEKRAQNFGMVGAAFGLGFIIGPVLGGLFSSISIRAPFFFAAGISFLNFIYGIAILPESLKDWNRRKFEFRRANPLGSILHLKKYPAISGFVVAFFLLYMAGQAIHSTWTYYTFYQFKWDARDVGLSLGYVGILIFLVQGVLIRVFIQLIGQTKTIYLGLFMNLSGLILIAFSFKPWMMMLFLIPYCLGGLAGPSLQGFISNKVSPKEQGELMGALTSLMNVTSILGPPIMTGLFYYFTNTPEVHNFPGIPFLAGAVFTIMGIILTVRTFNRN